MDPDANLAEQLAIVAEINAIRDSIPAPGDAALVRQLEQLAHLSFRLAELVEALDQWIRRSGNPPHAWTRDHAGWHQDGFVPTVS